MKKSGVKDVRERERERETSRSFTKVLLFLFVGIFLISVGSALVDYTSDSTPSGTIGTELKISVGGSFNYPMTKYILDNTSHIYFFNNSENKVVDFGQNKTNLSFCVGFDTSKIIYTNDSIGPVWNLSSNRNNITIPKEVFSSAKKTFKFRFKVNNLSDTRYVFAGKTQSVYPYFSLETSGNILLIRYGGTAYQSVPFNINEWNNLHIFMDSSNNKFLKVYMNGEKIFEGNLSAGYDLTTFNYNWSLFGSFGGTTKNATMYLNEFVYYNRWLTEDEIIMSEIVDRSNSTYNVVAQPGFFNYSFLYKNNDSLITLDYRNYSFENSVLVSNLAKTILKNSTINFTLNYEEVGGCNLSIEGVGNVLTKLDNSHYSFYVNDSFESGRKTFKVLCDSMQSNYSRETIINEQELRYINKSNSNCSNYFLKNSDLPERPLCSLTKLTDILEGGDEAIFSGESYNELVILTEDSVLNLPTIFGGASFNNKLIINGTGLTSDDGNINPNSVDNMILKNIYSFDANNDNFNGDGSIRNLTVYNFTTRKALGDGISFHNDAEARIYNYLGEGEYGKDCIVDVWSSKTYYFNATCYDAKDSLLAFQSDTLGQEGYHEVHTFYGECGNNSNSNYRCMNSLMLVQGQDVIATNITLNNTRSSGLVSNQAWHAENPATLAISEADSDKGLISFNLTDFYVINTNLYMPIFSTYGHEIDVILVNGEFRNGSLNLNDSNSSVLFRGVKFDFENVNYSNESNFTANNFYRFNLFNSSNDFLNNVTYNLYENGSLSLTNQTNETYKTQIFEFLFLRIVDNVSTQTSTNYTLELIAEDKYINYSFVPNTTYNGVTEINLTLRNNSETCLFDGNYWYENACYTDLATACSENGKVVNASDCIISSLSIISPMSTNYNSLSILVNVTSNGNTTWFTNSSGVNETYSIPVYRTFSEGSNTLKVYTNYTLGNLTESNVTFTITLPVAEESSSSGGSAPLKVVSLASIQSGATQTLAYGTKMILHFNEENHTIWLRSLNREKAEISLDVYSEKQNVSLKVGESKEIDLNGDGKADIKFVLLKIYENLVKVDLKIELLGNVVKEENKTSIGETIKNVVIEIKEKNYSSWIVGILILVLVVVGLVVLWKKKFSNDYRFRLLVNKTRYSSKCCLLVIC